MQDLAGGGTEMIMVRLTHGMAERGHAVDLVLVRLKGPYLAKVGPELKARVRPPGFPRFAAGARLNRPF